MIHLRTYSQIFRSIAQIIWVSGFGIFFILWANRMHSSQVWVVSLPVIFLNSPAVTSGIQPHFGFGADIAGILLFVIGWVLESVADAQKVSLFISPKEGLER